MQHGQKLLITRSGTGKVRMTQKALVRKNWQTLDFLELGKDHEEMKRRIFISSALQLFDEVSKK